MIRAGVTPEQARMVLPQNTYTEWYWTGSLYAFARVCGLRCKGDTQEEARNVAWEIYELAKDKVSNFLGGVVLCRSMIINVKVVDLN